MCLTCQLIQEALCSEVPESSYSYGHLREKLFKCYQGSNDRSSFPLKSSLQLVNIIFLHLHHSKVLIAALAGLFPIIIDLGLVFAGYLERVSRWFQ